MLARLRRYIKKRGQKSIYQMYSDICSDSVYCNGFSVDLRHPVKGRKYLEIGSHCIIDSKFVFEKETGFIKVGDRCHIGGGTKLISVDGIEIGNDVTIAWGCTIYDHNSHSIYWDERKNDTEQEYIDIKTSGDPIKNKNWSIVKSAPIKICDKVWIGYNVSILKGVTIGEGAIIGACSVVTKDVEPYSIVAGNPAVTVRRGIDKR